MTRQRIEVVTSSSAHSAWVDPQGRRQACESKDSSVVPVGSTTHLSPRIEEDDGEPTVPTAQFPANRQSARRHGWLTKADHGSGPSLTVPERVPPTADGEGWRPEQWGAGPPG
jgi:hypothetical protein